MTCSEYSDILHLPHHVSPDRKRMAAADRAAQFSPFAALTGYDDAIQEAGRLTDQRTELDESAKAALDLLLSGLQRQSARHPRITVTYFTEDEKKSGGAYIRAEGIFRKCDPYTRCLIFTDGRTVPIEDITDIEQAWE